MPDRPQTVNFSECLEALCRHLTATLAELAHIDPDRVLFTIAHSRAEGIHGTYARIAPLRFAGGAAEITRRRGPWRETYRMPVLHHQQREIHYLIAVFMPRFLRLSFTRKLATVIHELYHISAACDGDIRRFVGRNFAHGSSRAAYNRIVDRLTDDYLAAAPPADILAFLHLDETPWQRQTIRIEGLTAPIPRPRLIARSRA